MKIIHLNIKQGEVKIQVDDPDDLWYLSQAIDEGDIVSGKTLRKIRSQGEEDSSSAERKPVFISLRAEKIEFHKYSGSLRVGGKITQGPEDVPQGSYHTFNIEEGTTIGIIKPSWPKFQLDRIQEAAQQKHLKILVLVLDREQAIFALMKKYGYEILTDMSGNVEKKIYGTLQKSSGDFYADVLRALLDYDGRFNLESIIVASPAFWKDEFLRIVNETGLKGKIHTATCSSVSRNAIDEVLKRDELKKVLANDRVAKEMALVESLFLEISKGGAAAYGIAEVAKAVESGAAEKLLVTDALLQKSREGGSYTKIEVLMKSTESSRGDVTIISADNDAGKKLDGLGGIGAILRYKINY